MSTAIAASNLVWTALGRTSLLALLVAVCGCTSPAASSDPPATSRESRNAALAAARVWHPPSVPIAEARLASNPEGSPFSPERDLDCRFVERKAGGTTPKFYCQLPDGDVVKIKYGEGNPELPAEVAATRLLNALGFPADDMFVVRSVRCAGCPPYPFKALRCSQATGLHSLCFSGTRQDAVVTFPFAVVERKLEGRAIEAEPDQGWAFYELDAIDPTRGGSDRAEVDALRLLAVFLGHWDNKGPNQRLVCPAGADLPGGGCSRPLAILQDLGATFGPLKIDLHNWRGSRIWQDPQRCTVSMKHLPWGGATFPDRQISEEGRRHLLGLFEQLSDAQLGDLFEGARVGSHAQLTAEAASVASWVRAFKARVEEIRSGGPCPVSGSGAPAPGDGAGQAPQR